MGVHARPEIPFVPDPASTSPPSVVPIELDLPEPMHEPQVRMPQRALATPPRPAEVVAPEMLFPVAPTRSKLLPAVLTLGLFLGFGSVLVGLSVVLLAAILILA